MTFHFQRSYRGAIQLVIFDWAGTTIDHGSTAPAAAFIEGFRRQGVAISVAQARSPMGMGKRDHIRAITQMEPVAAEWQRVHGRAVTEQDIDAMYADFVPVLLDVLAEHSQLIPGTVAAVESLRNMGCRIGGTTGYFEEAMATCQHAAARQGYEPDSSICATQVSAGRPAPWMIFATMERLGVYPPEAVVKVGDTVPDIAAGLNAGVWTVGVARTGNEVGLTERELLALNAHEREARTARARRTLAGAGAHFVVDSVADVPGVVETIHAQLRQGQRP